VFHAVIDERADDHRGAGHLVRIVAFVTHGLCPGRAVGSGLFLGLFLLRKIKKGPRRPHAHRPNWDGSQPSPAVRLGTTTIRSLVIILHIEGARLPKGCANHSGHTPEVKGSRHFSAIWAV
jgi:hypothetical protein